MEERDTCVCYVIDDNYLLPTLVSAIQARAHMPADLADVVIATIGAPSAKHDIARRVCEAEDLHFIVVPPATIEHMHPMFGRLFMHHFLPEHYRRIVYIDGDTQVHGSLAPLATAPMEPGTFWAVRDPAGIFARLSGAWQRRVLADRAQAGLEADSDAYFNSGVLVMQCDSWPELAERTLAICRDPDTRLKFGDQDPMNMAIAQHCRRISNRWNFPGFLIGSEAERSVKPAIYHFMSNPRPWNYAVMPWGARWKKPYDDLVAAWPELAPLRPHRKTTDAIKYTVQQMLKYWTEYRPVGRLRETEPQFNV